jgi:hypothetical protein
MNPATIYNRTQKTSSKMPASGGPAGFSIIKGWRLVSALLCLFILASFELKNSNDEYKLKAVFLYNFTLYIEWEHTAIADEFVIGVLGESAIDEPLRQICHSKSWNGKRIVIHHFNSASDISSCHILFIPKNNNEPLDGILSKVPRGTLTVSEKSGYAEQGTAINFIIVGKKVKFESNLKAINSAGLKASSQLLKLAKIVG